MDLYIIRHAIAQPLGQKNDFTDEKRALTSEGRDRMREIARGLRKLGIELDMILTSPLVRAVETAEIVATALGVNKKDVEQTAALAPGGSQDELIAEIKNKTSAEAIALVGHQPDLGDLVSRIAQCGSSFSMQLKKGSICCINVTEMVPSLYGQVNWLMTPRQMRLVAKL